MQMELFGDGLRKPETKEEQLAKRDLAFFKEESSRLKESWNYLLANEPDEETQNKLMAGWWYCNFITGWENPPSTDHYLTHYDSEPGNEYMAEPIRNGWITVRRKEIKWDKDYALRRLKKAIESYETRLR